MTAQALSALEQRLGYVFAESALLREAMTHSTYANENTDAGPNNERLEFLGDAVVDLLVAEHLYRHPEAPAEGAMSRHRAQVVRCEALAGRADALELGAFLLLGGGRRRAQPTPSMLADAFEALVGAVFLDRGYDAARGVFGPMFAHAPELQRRNDHKTYLQELCHRRGLPPPTYSVMAESGPAHARSFTCAVQIAARPRFEASGQSKRQAEQRCAELALAALQSEAES